MLFMLMGANFYAKLRNIYLKLENDCGLTQGSYYTTIKFSVNEFGKQVHFPLMLCSEAAQNAIHAKVKTFMATEVNIWTVFKELTFLQVLPEWFWLFLAVPLWYEILIFVLQKENNAYSLPDASLTIATKTQKITVPDRFVDSYSWELLENPVTVYTETEVKTETETKKPTF